MSNTSPTSVVYYDSSPSSPSSPSSSKLLEQKSETVTNVKQPITEQTQKDIITTLASLITFVILLFIFHKILNAAYDYRKLIPGSQLAQTLHNYTVLLNYFRRILSESDSKYTENLIILLDTIYYVVFLIIPEKIGLPDEVREYILKMPKVFAGRPHIQAFLKILIGYLEQNGFNDDIVNIMNESLELASDFFRITYAFTLDRGAIDTLSKITIQAITEFDSETNALILAPQPNKLSVGLDIFKRCFEKITNVNSALRSTMDFESRSEDIGKVIINSLDYINANLQVLYRRNIKGDNKTGYDDMLYSQTRELVPYEPNFIGKIDKLQSSIEELLYKYMPFIKQQMPLAEEVEGGKRRKSRKNKKNKRTKTNKKRFKSRKRYSRNKRSILYKLV
jgi:hypothetical protein